MYIHARHFRKHNTLQALQQKNATRTSLQKRFRSKSLKVRTLQKLNHTPRRLKRIRKFPKPQEKTIQSQTPIRGKFLRSVYPSRNN